MSTSPPLDDDLSVVPFTDNSEHLYRRIVPAHIQNGRIVSAAFAFRKPGAEEPPSGLSFNRSSMSRPTDVLRGAKEGARVAAIQVGAAPKEIQGATTRFVFQVEHKPIHGNRSHSEIRAYDDDGVFHAYPADGVVRKAFRERLALVALPLPIDVSVDLG